MSRHVPPVNEVVFLHSVTKSAAGVALAASAALALAACGSTSSSTSELWRRWLQLRPGAADLASARSTTRFSAMATLKPLAAQGKGNVAVHPARHGLLDPLCRVRRART